MSNHDDFWTNLAAGHTNTVLAGAMDSHLSGKSIDESFGSVRTLTDVHRQANALPLPVEAGTKVVFAGGLGAHMSYDDVPADGITGEVVTVKSATGSITHHDGKVFVKWADGKFRPIHAEHLRLAGQDKQAGYRSLSPNEHEQLLDAIAAEVKKYSRGDEIWAGDVVEALGKKYSIENVDAALKYLANYQGIVKKSPRFNRLMWIKKGSQDKQASGNTLKVLRDGRDYWIEGGGSHRTWGDRFNGPFTAADVVGEVEERLKKDPDVVVMGRNHSLGRSGAADAYSTAPFVILDRRGDVVDEGYTLEGLWNKWFDRVLGWRMASAMPRKKMENAIAGKMPPDSKKGRGANRVIMLTGDSAKVIGKDNYSSHKMSDLSDDEITTLYNFLVLGRRASDVKATFEKIKALAEKKPKNKFLKDLLKQMADEGFTPTEKQMKVVKEIEGEIEQQSEMKKELKGLDKDAAFDPSTIGEKKGGPVEHDPEDKNIMGHFGQGGLHGMTEVAKGKTATFRVASLGDLTQFLKVADGTLVHKSTKDLWSFNKDADGNFLVSRLFDDEGEPLKV